MSPVPNIEWLLFDLVGTLLHVTPSVSVIYANVAREHGVKVSPMEIEERFPSAMAQSFQTTTYATSRRDQKQRWRKTVACCFPDLKLDVQQKIFEQLWRCFQNTRSWQCDTAWPSIAMSLRAQGFRLAIASNFDQRIYPLVQSIPELASNVEQIFCSADLGWSKPHFQFFHNICQSLRCQPQQLCMIGDSYNEDYQGASQAGWCSILFDAKAQFPSSPNRIICLADLPRTLSRHRSH